MTWSWSHTSEGLHNASCNVHDLSRRTLTWILDAWRLHDKEAGEPVHSFRDHRRSLRRLSHDTLADSVWDRASELQLCSNGGHDCYLDPDGLFTVPFSDPEEEKERRAEYRRSPAGRASALDRRSPLLRHR